MEKKAMTQLLDYLNAKPEIIGDETLNKINELIEVEKQQIVDSYDKGWHDRGNNKYDSGTKYYNNIFNK